VGSRSLASKRLRSIPTRSPSTDPTPRLLQADACDTEALILEHLDRLAANQVSIADRIRTAIRTETPLYSSFDDTAQEAAWAAGIDAGLAMFIASAREDRGPTAPELAAMAAIGHERADQPRMTLDAMDASVRVAVARTLDFVLEHLDGIDERQRAAVRELHNRLTRFGNEITAAMLNAFVARKEQRAAVSAVLAVRPSRDTEDRYRQAIVARVKAREDDLVGHVLTSMMTELPEYASGRSRAQIEEIATAVRRAACLCLETIGDGGPIGEAEVRSLELVGGQRARQGIPRDVVLDSVKVATRVGRAFLMTCGEVGNDTEALMAAYRTIIVNLDRFEDVVVEALGRGYDAATREQLSGPDRGEAILVDRLLESRFQDEEEALKHAADVGLMTSLPAYVVVLVGADDSAGTRLRDAAHDLRGHLRVAVGPARYTSRPHLPLLVQVGRPESWAATIALLEQVACARAVVVAYADAPASLTGLSPVYRSLQQGLPFLGAALADPGTVPALLLRFHRTLAVGTPEERLEMVHHVLEPLYRLPEREAAELLETLDAVSECGASPTALVPRLHVHKNTIGNRLRRVREVTGLDLRRPSHRLVLETSLRMRRVADVDVAGGSRAGGRSEPSRGTVSTV
jgi:hypothetical protein